MEIGCNINEARISKGLTQKQLAKKIHTLQPSIARAERGNSLPSLSFLLRVSKALKVHISELLKIDPRTSQEIINELKLHEH